MIPFEPTGPVDSCDHYVYVVTVGDVSESISPVQAYRYIYGELPASEVKLDISDERVIYTGALDEGQIIWYRFSDTEVKLNKTAWKNASSLLLKNGTQAGRYPLLSSKMIPRHSRTMEMVRSERI